MTDPTTRPVRQGCGKAHRFGSAALLAMMLALGPLMRGETNAPSADKVFFRNGDSLVGKLVAFNLQSGIQWGRADAVEPVVFDPGNITSVNLGVVPPPAAWPSASFHVRLRGDDFIEGVLESCDSNSVRIVTPWAGVLTAPRNAVASVAVIPPPQSAIYDGPTGLDGWVQAVSALAPIGASQWSYRNGAFYSSKSASIARDVGLPAVASIQFDLRWQSTILVAVALYADRPQPVSLTAKDNEPAFGGFYSFQLNSTMADLLAVKQGDPQRTFEPAIVPWLSQTNRVHVDLRVNTNRATVTLLLNGQMIKEWVDPTGFIGRGTMLRFVNQGLGPVKISNLRVTRWDGVLDERPPINPAGKQDSVRLTDDSVVVGEVMAISNGMMSIANAQGLAQIPLSRLKQLDFARIPAARTGVAPANVRVFFGQTSRLAIQLDQYDQKTVQGVSANFEKIQIDAASVTRLQMLR